MLSFTHKGQKLNARIDRPQELDTTFIDKDGWRRNLAKFKWEWVWANHWASEAEASHGSFVTAALNKLVAHFRHAPYLNAHIVFIVTPLVLTALGGMLYLLLAN